MAHYELSSLKEWAPLTDLLNKIPSRTGGIFANNIQLTCVDVLPEFLLLGTNVGTLFWYDRKTKELEQLKGEDYKVPITCVKVVSSVEYMVACGNSNGKIVIFQIPKVHPESLPENLRQGKKQVEKYTVTDLHKSPITALEWSKNGMKIFSGDKMGTVVLTELDFYMHMCKSIEILNESYEVTQLSYLHQKLLISTTFRSILCFRNQNKWIVQQVGKKDRKVLGKYGGLIYQYGFKASESILYCCRPGLRIWVANNNGNVEKTLLFKDILYKGCYQVQLLNPISKELENIKPQNEPTFGKLLLFANDLLITYNNDIVYVIHPDKMTVLATIPHLRNIIDVATYKDEIFILEESHSLLRISFQPEVENSSSNTTIKNRNGFLLNSTDLLKSFTQTPIMSTSTVTNNTMTETNTSLITDAEEAVENKQVVNDVDDVDNRHKNFSNISTQKFEDKILYRKFRKTKNKINKTNGGSAISLNSNSSEEKESNNIKTVHNMFTMGMLPDLRSPDSIISDIEYKEKILADVLNLEKIKIVPYITAQVQEAIENNEEIPNESHIISNIIEIPIKNNDDVDKTKKESIDKVILMPNEWNLSSIQINNNKSNGIGPLKMSSNCQVEQCPQSSPPDDGLLSDWEII